MYLWFCLCGFNQPWTIQYCNAYLWKNIHIEVTPMHFQPALFKDQLCMFLPLLQRYRFLQNLSLCNLVPQLCPTLYNPKHCNPPDFTVYGILQARILEWIPLLEGIVSTQGSNPRLLSHLQCRQILYLLNHQGSPCLWSAEQLSDPIIVSSIISHSTIFKCWEEG